MRAYGGSLKRRIERRSSVRPIVVACSGVVLISFGALAGCGSGSDAASTGSIDGGPFGARSLPDGSVFGGRPLPGMGLPDGGACLSQVRKGEALPLDMYVLLDKSSSMTETTSTGATKWDAIRAALESFLDDPGSAGIGVGLQYFPLLKPGVPATCTTHAECNGQGPCFTTACDNQATFTLCETDADCGQRGACQPFGACEYYPAGGSPIFCGPIGSTCNGQFGQCLDIPDRWCVNGTQCTRTAYSTPAVPITTLPGGAAPLVASLRATAPEGRTPTAPALQGAVDQARSWAAAHPGHKVVAVLATDGLPTECTPTDITQVAAIAGTGGQIPVFVIGVFAPEDTQSPTNLNVIAKSGGTGQAFIVQTNGDVTKQFLSALDSVRGSALLACELQVPAADAMKGLDYLRVNLELTANMGSPKQLVYVGNASGCSSVPGAGWYYDVDPSAGTPTKILVCADVCSSLQSLPGATINLQIGCKTLVH